jgi:hypothetical protein
MQVDTKGRLWVAVWRTYPKWEPLKEMKDALSSSTTTTTTAKPIASPSSPGAESARL